MQSQCAVQRMRSVWVCQAKIAVMFEPVSVCCRHCGHRVVFRSCSEANVFLKEIFALNTLRCICMCCNDVSMSLLVLMTNTEYSAKSMFPYMFDMLARVPRIYTSGGYRIYLILRLVTCIVWLDRCMYVVEHLVRLLPFLCSLV